VVAIRIGEKMKQKIKTYLLALLIVLLLLFFFAMSAKTNNPYNGTTAE